MMSSIKGKRSEQSGESIVLPPTAKITSSVPVSSEQLEQQNRGSTKLVFGLNSRANKVKHAEYAERRSGQQSFIELKGAKEAIVEQTSESVSSNKLHQMNATNNGSSQVVPKQTVANNSIRASKQGNFHKQQEFSDKDSSMKNEVKVLAKNCSEEVSSLTQKKRTTVASSKQATNNKSTSLETSSREEKTVGTNDKSIKKGEQQKRQFNIPPPPQIGKSPTGKSSVVSYAKSRIYDRPTASSLLLDSGRIPDSILSGFKPPKQVSVSKAREKWEGGELFAKTKSNRRLAAQAAGKKLLHGTWSMTSVVATQQMQFQQALANSSAPVRSNLEHKDPSVKILTRGSVLERVQQFEKVPVESSSAGSSDASSLSSSSSNEDDLDGSWSSSSGSELDNEVSIAIDTTANIQQLKGPVGKQAQYKQLVSSIQTATAVGSSLEGNPLVGSPKVLSKSQASTQAAATATRRLSFRRKSSFSSNSSSFGNIPRFHHPNGKPNTYEIELQKKNIVACFDKLPDRKAVLTGPMSKRHFHSVALACGLSEYFKMPLCLYVKHHLTNSNLLHGSTIRKTSVVLQQNGTSASQQQQQQEKLQQQPIKLTRAASVDNSTMEKLQNQTYITCDQFLICWRNMLASCFDNAAKFVHLLTLGQRDNLVPHDFVPLIQSVIDDHPGLKFLRSAPDFHMRYIQTVIARIFYSINRSWTGKIGVKELRRSNFLAVLQVLSQEEDINQITDYFSYEHFYVIYCKFWNLDQDHDLLISKEDLARHNDAAISSRIIDRIFMGIVSKQIQETGKMSYSDFVWFLLAEEDKKHPRSIEYWFRLMDIDGDGYISMYELEYFYYEQTKRLELMNIEALPFLDTACQILDLINPKEKNKISLSDLKKTKLATIFFDTFINLEKYLEHESREFVSTRDVVQDGVLISDWDRYASEEYENLVTEETSI